MNILFTVLIFLFTLSVLIIVHEYGHYRMAKFFGVKVLRFSIGFGKPFFTWRVGKDQTEFALAPYPFGGYVRMLDSRDKEMVISDEEIGRDFNRKPLYQRALIIFAGPAANLLLAIVFIALTAMLGMQSYAAKIALPTPNSMLTQAGVQAGDEVTGISIDNATMEEIPSLDELSLLLQYAVSHEKDVRLQVKRPDGYTFEAGLPLSTLGAEGATPYLLWNLGFTGLWAPPKITLVVTGGAAEQAGIQAGDYIQSINGLVISDTQLLSKTIQTLESNDIAEFLVRRDDELISLHVQPSQIERPIIGALTETEAPHQHGLREGDHVRRVNDEFISERTQLTNYLASQAQGTALEWYIERDERIMKISFPNAPINITGKWDSKIDVQLSGPEKIIIRYSFFKSLNYGVEQTWLISRLILTSIANMIAGKSKVQDNLSGPIEIANVASESAQRGLSEYISILAKISISLGILNLLPLPVLDGGHLFLYMIEAVRRKPLPEKWVGNLQRIGILLLITLMLFVTFNDILRRL